MAPGRSVVLVAGEASGDQHATKLARELLALDPGLTISGIGGPELEAAGAELLYRSEDLALVGVAEVLPKLRVILGAIRGLKRHMKRTRPQVVILVDFPDFNFRVGKAARKLGLKVLYYISPQVWAWRPKRALQMAAFVDQLACVFPFEPRFFRLRVPKLAVSFVGHPLMDDPPQDWSEPLPVPHEAELVGLLPGSRMSEIIRLLPLLLGAARRMQERRPGLHFVLPLAPGLKREEVEPYLKGTPRGLTIIPGRARQVMAQSRLLLVASGTATLQAALAGTPGGGGIQDRRLQLPGGALLDQGGAHRHAQFDRRPPSAARIDPRRGHPGKGGRRGPFPAGRRSSPGKGNPGPGRGPRQAGRTGGQPQGGRDGPGHDEGISGFD